MAETGQTESGHLTGVVLPGDQVDIHSAGVTPLMLACYDGEVGRVREILQAGYRNIQAVNHYNATALDYAVDNHQMQVVDILLGYGADLDALNQDGQGILHRCVLTKQLDKVTTCIHVGANLDLRNRNGDTALHVAIRNQLVEIARVLIENACDTTARNQEGFTAHECAFLYLNDNLEIQRAISRDSNNTFRGLVGDRLLYACSTGDVVYIEATISEYGDQVVQVKGDQNVTPVFIASHNGHLDALMTLCRYRPNVNVTVDDGNSPLIYAAVRNHIEVVRYLITQGARVNFRNVFGRTALHCAVIEQKLEAVKILVTSGTLLNLRSENGSTALYIAAEKNSLDTVKYLVEHGALVDAVNIEGVTPLLMAVDNNSMEMIQYLIEHGANIAQCDYFQCCPLNVAVGQNKLSVVQYLVEHGADIDVRSPEGTTIADSALACGNHDIYRYLTDRCNRLKQNTGSHQNNDMLNMSNDLSLQQHLFHMVYSGSGTHDDVKLLMRKGADINGMDHTGRTPLITAIASSHQEHVAWLLHEQVDVNLTDSSGCSPLIHAVLADSLDITELLLTCHCVSPSQIHALRVNPLQIQKGDVHPTQVQTGTGHPGFNETQTTHQRLHIDQTDSTGKTALSHSAESQHRFANQIATKLIRYGADVNIVDSAQQTILEKCVCRGKSELVDLLLANGAVLLPLCPGLLIDICLSSDAQTLGHCIRHLLASNSEKCGPYINLVLNFAAANCNNLDKGGLLDILNSDILWHIMKVLTPEMLDINCLDNNVSSLGMTAAGTGMLELVGVLLQRGVVPKLTNQHSQAVVCQALKNGQYEVIAALASEGALELDSSDVVIVTPGADEKDSVKEYHFRDIQVEPAFADIKSLWAEALDLVYDSVILTFIRKPLPFIRGISRGWSDSVLYIHVDEFDSDQCENYITGIPYIEMYRRELVTARYLATPLTYTGNTSYRGQQYSVSTPWNSDDVRRGCLMCVFKNWSTGAYWALTTADAVYTSTDHENDVQSSDQLLVIKHHKPYVIKSCCGLKSVNVAALLIKQKDLRKGDLGLFEFVFRGRDSTLLQRKVTKIAPIQGLGDEVQGIVVDVNVTFQDQHGRLHHGAFVVSSVDQNQIFAKCGQSGAAVVDTDNSIVLGLVVAAQHGYLGRYKHVTFCLRLDHALMELYQRYNVNIGMFRSLEKEDG